MRNEDNERVINEYNLSVFSKEMDELIELFHQQDDFIIVKKMKQLIPEFISNNSVFEKLDIPENK